MCIYVPPHIFTGNLRKAGRYGAGRGVPSSLRAVFDECPAAVLVEGDPQFLLCVHHYGPVPRDRFAEGFSRYEQETHALGLSGDRYLLSAVKQDQAVVAYERR